MTTVYYVAHPYYSGKGTIESNMDELNKICNNLLDMGYTILSPCTMGHPLEKLKTREPDFWYKHSIELLKKCDGIIMCGDWRRSKGCMMEFYKAKDMGIEIIAYDYILAKNIPKNEFHDVKDFALKWYKLGIEECEGKEAFKYDDKEKYDISPLFTTEEQFEKIWEENND